MAQSKFERLRELLRELFMFDQADLDFGIYRIMNARREELTRFLDKDLLPQVREALGEIQSAGQAQAKGELDEAIENLRKLGVDPQTSPRVRELQAKCTAGPDVDALETQVFSDLYNFFSRYYKEGDFISLRRYKEGVYAIPYEGEEVKLHWANADQYYIKSAEHFRDYAFKLPDGRRVHFKLVAADTEANNNQAPNGRERRFILRGDPVMREEDGELVIPFEYRPDPERRKQAELNADAVARILAEPSFAPWTTALAANAPTEKNPDRTLLEKHLTDYTARNTFDYFIHKDLGGFLHRELDFYIKSEVMHLDDIEAQAAPKVEEYLAQVRAIRRVALKIIDFLAQLEDFQKKLWLKKKFVIETQYCITLDRVPETLYPEVAANEAQREEWVHLFAIDGIKGYAVPLTVDFLKNNPFLVLDTRFFDQRFTDRLLASLDNLEQQTDGVLIHSENLQALNLLEARYRQQAGCIYIDPPYNSKTTAILYKNNYRHSSWATLMDNRLVLSRCLAAPDGSHIVAIDENEQEVLGLLLSSRFPDHEKICVAVMHNKKGIQGDYFSTNHDYAYFLIPPGLPETYGKPIPEAEWDYVNLRKWGRESERSTAKNCFYPIFVKDNQVAGFGSVCGDDFHPERANIPDGKEQTAVYPVDGQSVERKWRYARGSVEAIRPLLKVHVTHSGEIQIHKASSLKPHKTVWDDSRYIAGDYGTRWLTDLGLKVKEDLYPKSIYTVEDAIFAVSGKAALVVDYFAGSGTTGHAVIDLNRGDQGQRKYVLVEMADYFDTVLKPRISKIIYSKDWKGGKPVSREGSSHLLKYIRLESYEDALNNLRLRRTAEQAALLGENARLREEYTLRYMLDVESRGSPTLLDLDSFEDPFSYTLQVAAGGVGETRPVVVDLAETFNYLIGLKVSRMDVEEGVRIVEGTNPAGERVLVIWRNLKKHHNVFVDELFRKRQYREKGAEFGLVYVNGDNNLENMRQEVETWKVRLIEEEFRRLMFDVRDV